MTEVARLAVAEERPRRRPMQADIEASKGSVYYRAHSYHTKVPVEGLVQLIEHYTDPGEFVLDSFCGSGQTGVAALLTGRHAILSDLSPAAVHIARGYTARVDPDRFEWAAGEVLRGLAALEHELYGAPGARIEYTVWSDVHQCPTCQKEIRFWEEGVDHEAGAVRSNLMCPARHGPFKKTELEWIRSEPVQENLSVEGRRTRLVRPVSSATLSWVSSRISSVHWFPTVPWEPWREMWRAQHRDQGIATSADFFTPRNLCALSALWEQVGRVEDDPMRLALRFAFTACVNRASRRYQWHPKRPTNVLSSTMYLASLNYEFNVFSLFRRKVTTISQMYRKMWGSSGSCEVHLGSADNLEWVSDDSVDYVFVDPPFGSNIYYSDSSFLWEAWLGEYTDVAAETVVNKRLPDELGRSSIGDYEKSMSRSMSELSRVMRADAWASVQFHNSDDGVWSTIQNAIDSAGLGVEAAAVMDKGQASFKGLRHESRGERVAKFDLVLHLQRANGAVHPITRRVVAQPEIEAELRAYVARQPPARRTTPWLHSQVMRYLLAQNASPASWSFAAAEELCHQIFERRGSAWHMPT